MEPSIPEAFILQASQAHARDPRLAAARDLPGAEPQGCAEPESPNAAPPIDAVADT